MNNIYNKLLPFIFGAVCGYLIVKLLLSSSVLGYMDLEKMINSKRKYPLRNSPKLDQIAYCRARYLVENNLWTHDGHEKCFNKYGVYSYGEILAKDFIADYDTVIAWLNSPSHKTVMLERWKYIGSSKVGNITVVVFR